MTLGVWPVNGLARANWVSADATAPEPTTTRQRRRALRPVFGNACGGLSPERNSAFMKSINDRVFDDIKCLCG